ncbi:MAG: hypothetical protein ACTSUF_08025 [Candidatus Heimdallarchaeaceae archaeon]
MELIGLIGKLNLEQSDKETIYDINYLLLDLIKYVTKLEQDVKDVESMLSHLRSTKNAEIMKLKGY